MEIQFLCADALNGGNQAQIGEVPVQSPRGSDAVATRQRPSADPQALDTCRCSDDSWGSAPCMAGGRAGQQGRMEIQWVHGGFSRMESAGLQIDPVNRMVFG